MRQAYEEQTATLLAKHAKLRKAWKAQADNLRRHLKRASAGGEEGGVLRVVPTDAAPAEAALVSRSTPRGTRWTAR